MTASRVLWQEYDAPVPECVPFGCPPLRWRDSEDCSTVLIAHTLPDGRVLGMELDTAVFIHYPPVRGDGGDIWDLASTNPGDAEPLSVPKPRPVIARTPAEEPAASAVRFFLHHDHRRVNEKGK